jgi:ketosteroid isomerase-like protein
MARQNSPVHGTVASLVRRAYAAYESKDRASLETLLSDDFTFNSPQDDHIDKAQYFRRCWPFSKKVRAFHIENLVVKGNEAFVRYLCEPKSGRPFRNTECFRVEGGRIKAVDVYFGRSLPKAKPARTRSTPGGARAKRTARRARVD